MGGLWEDGGPLEEVAGEEIDVAGDGVGAEEEKVREARGKSELLRESGEDGVGFAGREAGGERSGLELGAELFDVVVEGAGGVVLGERDGACIPEGEKAAVERGGEDGVRDAAGRVAALGAAQRDGGGGAGGGLKEGGRGRSDEVVGGAGGNVAQEARGGAGGEGGEGEENYFAQGA